MANVSLLDSKSPEPALSRRSLLCVLLVYGVSIFIATYPALLTFTSRLAGCRSDPLQSLWLMRWYKDCLLHGRSVLHCPDIQFPVGAPLGNFSPLHLQTLLYIPLSLVFENDVLCYNTIWFFNIWFTGFGTFVLIWYILRERVCACFGGLLAMLCGPMLLHANGHIELISLGWLPLFVAAWVRWVDGPNKRRLLTALSLYLMVACSAAYFAVFALVPAVAYVVWRAAGDRRQQVLPWLKSRIGWFSAFVVIVAPGLLLIFFPQVLSRVQGYSLSRPKGEFNLYGAPPWSFVIPSYVHALSHLLPFDLYDRAGAVTVECCSYLGVVTVILLGYAAFTRAPFERSRYWWSLFLICAVLSFGAYWKIGTLRVSLPAEWLRKALFLYRAIRVPARFNLCAGVFAAVLAAAGLRHLLGRFPNRYLQAAVVGALGSLAVADLAMIPFQTSVLPSSPACYDILRERNPQAAFLEVPQFGSGTCADLSSACTYWQAQHHGRTAAGYSGYDNVIYDNLIFQPSPFAWPRLAKAAYLQNPEAVSVDLISDTRFEDYAWLYLTVHHLDYVVLHQEPDLAAEFRLPGDRLKSLLRHARIFEDQATAMYDRTLLQTPHRSTLLCTEGWRQRSTWRGRQTCALSKAGQIAVFNPKPEQALTFTLEGVALHQPRTVRLLANGMELSQWQVTPDELGTYTSPPLRLPGGLSTLVLESDGEERPDRADVTYEGDTSPYSLRVARIGIFPSFSGGTP